MSKKKFRPGIDPGMPTLYTAGEYERMAVRPHEPNEYCLRAYWPRDNRWRLFVDFWWSWDTPDEQQEALAKVEQCAKEKHDAGWRWISIVIYPANNRRD